MTTNTNKKGFTLIELMIVVAIIGILAAIAVQTLSLTASRTKLVQTIIKIDVCGASPTLLTDKRIYGFGNRIINQRKFFLFLPIDVL